MPTGHALDRADRPDKQIQMSERKYKKYLAMLGSVRWLGLGVRRLLVVAREPKPWACTLSGPFLLLLSKRDLTAQDFAEYADTQPAWAERRNQGRGAGQISVDFPNTSD